MDKPSTDMPQPAIALERLLVKRRTLGGELLSVDMADRWSGMSPEQISEMAGTAPAEHRQVTTELNELVARLRMNEPEAVRRWAAAHETLLDEYIARLERDPHHDTTCTFVAREERKLWGEVLRGERSFVEENVVYVHVDPELHRSLFGE